MLYDVEYSYLVPEYDHIQIEADDIDSAENLALDKLSDVLPRDITEMAIESITLLKEAV